MWTLFFSIVALTLINETINRVFKIPFKFTENIVVAHENVIQFIFNKLEIHCYSLSNNELIFLSIGEDKKELPERWYIFLTICNIVFIFKLRN